MFLEAHMHRERRGPLAYGGAGDDIERQCAKEACLMGNLVLVMKREGQGIEEAGDYVSLTCFGFKCSRESLKMNSAQRFRRFKVGSSRLWWAERTGDLPHKKKEFFSCKMN